MSPTPQTLLLLNSAAGSKRKAKSNISQQVDLIWDEIESLQSSTMSLHENKHQHFLAKLEAKSEHQHDMKKYDWITGFVPPVSMSPIKPFSAINANRRTEILRFTFMR
jgi:hypothetical protein